MLRFAGGTLPLVRGKRRRKGAEGVAHAFSFTLLGQALKPATSMFRLGCRKAEPDVISDPDSVAVPQLGF